MYSLSLPKTPLWAIEVEYSGSRLLAHSPMAQTMVYPSDASLDYKVVTENTRKMMFMYKRTKDDNEDSMSRTIIQGQFVRQPFFLSTLDNISKLKSYLLIAQSADQHNISPGGGEWYNVVNGGPKHYLSDNGGWTVQSNFGSGHLASSKYDYVSLIFFSATCTPTRAQNPIIASLSMVLLTILRATLQTLQC